MFRVRPAGRGAVAVAVMRLDYDSNRYFVFFVPKAEPCLDGWT